MKIKSIESIEDYGIFLDYKKNGTKDFGINNIIFGWNYTGKTTLSRIFRSLESKKYHPDYADAKFKIVIDDDTVVKQNEVPTNSLKIRVFNSDYIHENLHWGQSHDGIPPILIVGEENIKLEEEISRLKIKKEGVEAQFNSESANKVKDEDSLSTSLTNEARRITNELSLGRLFDKTNLIELIDNSHLAEWTLSDDDFKKNKLTAQSASKLDSISEIALTPDDDIITAVKTLLLKSVTPTKTIERLKQNVTIENWVRDGRSLHVGKNKCEFCQGELPKDLLCELDGHFSKDYEAFREEVETCADTLEKKKLFADLKTKNDFYQELQKDYLAKKKALETEIKKYNQTIDELVKLVKNKISHLSKEVVIDESICLNTKDIELKTKELNDVIKKNEQKTIDFDRIKQQSIESLKKHYASIFYTSNKIAEKKAKIETQKSKIQESSKDIETIKIQIGGIEAQISETTKGSEVLNTFIKVYLGQNAPIEIKVKEKQFHVYRGDEEATNLSEGEKTAISFSYFLARLNDKDTKDILRETIVFLDDPISSLDSNHLYNTYSLIVSFLKNKCGQLFVSTHNYEFFNLLKDEFAQYRFRKEEKCDHANKGHDRCEANLYQIERNDTNAKLSNLDCNLCRFKSEYQYLFYQLYQFKDGNTSADEYKLYTMPNLLRRFLETYLGFNYPADTVFKNRLKNLIKNEEERKLVHKISDELSHSENTERVFKLYNTDEIKQAIELTFKAFECDETKKNYLSDLKKSIGLPA
jgi:wobble nucleotide-excising tRNase